MKRALPWTGLMLVFVLAGCPFGPPATTTVTIELRNQGDFPVEARLIFGSDPTSSAQDLRLGGTRIVRSMGPGETVRIERSCGEVGSMLLDEAEMIILGAIPRRTSGDVLRRDVDFTCSQTLRYTFTHPTVPTALNAEFTAVPQ